MRDHLQPVRRRRSHQSRHQSLPRTARPLALSILEEAILRHDIVYVWREHLFYIRKHRHLGLIGMLPLKSMTFNDTEAV